MQSSIDRHEAVTVGRLAVQAALNGETSKMVGIFRDHDETGDYRASYHLVDIKDVMMTERKLPDKFINKDGNYITEEFKEWIKPLLTQSDYFPIVNFN